MYNPKAYRIVLTLQNGILVNLRNLYILVIHLFKWFFFFLHSMLCKICGVIPSLEGLMCGILLDYGHLICGPS